MSLNRNSFYLSLNILSLSLTWISNLISHQTHNKNSLWNVITDYVCSSASRKLIIFNCYNKGLRKDSSAQTFHRWIDDDGCWCSFRGGDNRPTTIEIHGVWGMCADLFSSLDECCLWALNKAQRQRYFELFLHNVVFYNSKVFPHLMRVWGFYWCEAGSTLIHKREINCQIISN